MADAVEIETGKNPQASVIWMHGLGADAHDFEPIVPELAALLRRPVRFVFPNAPLRQITVAGGQRMRAWFDIADFTGGSKPDAVGIRASAQAIGELVRRENEREIGSTRIALAGFSQGGAMAVYTGVRYPQRLAGIMGLSCFELLADTLDAERQAANQQAPVFVGHGSYDPLVDIRRGRQLHDTLASRHYAVEWHEYPIEHSVSMQEVRDVGVWLERVLAR